MDRRQRDRQPATLPLERILMPVGGGGGSRRRSRRLVALAVALAAGIAAAAAAILVPRHDPRPEPPHAPVPRPRLAVPAKPTPTKATPVRRVRVSAADAAAHAERASVERLVRLGRPLYCGGGRGRYVALSFDDGPGPYTVRLLNLLHSARAKATFFLVGNRIHYWPLLPGREATLAALGDHTWNHADLTRLSPLAVRQELTDARVAIERASHRPVLLFRPPYERHDAAIDRRVREAGMLEVLWSLDPGDYVRNRTPSRVASLIEAHLRPGAIVLLHDIKPTTVQVVRRLLPVLRRRRLVPVTIPQLVRLDPPSAAQVRLGLAGCSGPLDRRRGE